MRRLVGAAAWRTHKRQAGVSAEGRRTHGGHTAATRRALTHDAPCLTTRDARPLTNQGTYQRASHFPRPRRRCRRPRGRRPHPRLHCCPAAQRAAAAAPARGGLAAVRESRGAFGAGPRHGRLTRARWRSASLAGAAARGSRDGVDVSMLSGCCLGGVEDRIQSRSANCRLSMRAGASGEEGVGQARKTEEPLFAATPGARMAQQPYRVASCATCCRSRSSCDCCLARSTAMSLRAVRSRASRRSVSCSAFSRRLTSSARPSTRLLLRNERSLRVEASVGESSQGARAGDAAFPCPVSIQHSYVGTASAAMSASSSNCCCCCTILCSSSLARWNQEKKGKEKRRRKRMVGPGRSGERQAQRRAQRRCEPPSPAAAPPGGRWHLRWGRCWRLC